MEVFSLIDSKVNSLILKRLDSLNTESVAQWGKMSLGQMLAHCSIAIEYSLEHPKKKQNWFWKLIGPSLANRLTGPVPYKQGEYTPAFFKMTSEKEFDVEIQRLKELVRYYPEAIKNCPSKVHTQFGFMSDENWGKLQWKHIDHHLKQFGV